MALRLITDQTWAELKRMKRKLDSIIGPGVTNAPDAISINWPMAGKSEAGTRRIIGGFHARLTDYSVGEFDFRHQRRSSDDSAWEDMPGGYSSGIVSGMFSVGTRCREVSGNLGYRAHLTAGEIVWINIAVRDGQSSPEYFFIAQPAKFLARIDANTALSTASVDVGGGGSVSVDYRWKYEWIEVERDADGVSDMANGRTGVFADSGTTYAINLAELNGGSAASGTKFIVFGFDMLSSNYPTGHRPRPIGAGSAANTHYVDTIVEITVVTDTNGNAVYHFDRMGIHGEACT